MTIIALQSVAATAVELAVSQLPQGTAFVDVQYSTRLEFDWSLSPIARFGAAGTVRLDGLNQLTRYFMRGRSRSADGTPGEWSPTVALFTPAAAARIIPPPGVMNAPALIATPEPVVRWACSSEVEGYPAAALGRDDPISSLWIRKAQAQFAFRAFMSGAPVDTIALLASNASEDCTVTVKAGPTEDNVNSNAPAFSYGPVPFRASPNLPQRESYHSLVRLPQAVSQPVWRVEIRGTVPGDVLVLTYAVFGKARQTKNFSADKSELSGDLGSISRDRSGIANRVRGFRSRSVELELSYLTEAQYELVLSDLARMVGTTDPVLVVPNSLPGPFLHDRILFGQLRPVRVVNTSVPWFTTGISVDSLI